MILFQQLLVDTGTPVETLCPGKGDHLDQILVAIQILGQHDQVPTASVVLRGQFTQPAMTGTIAFASDDRLEDIGLCLRNLRFQLRDLLLCLPIQRFLGTKRLQLLLGLFDLTLILAVFLIDLVEELLDAEHDTMIRHGQGTHSILMGLLDQRIDRSLTVQQGVLRMYMQMNKRLHTYLILLRKNKILSKRRVPEPAKRARD